MKPLILALGLLSTPALAREELPMPPEITPAIRAACEADVRRLCVGRKPTVERVKSCVIEKFDQLNHRCKMQLATAGLA